VRDLRAAIIGCGKIADQHAQQIRRVRGTRLVAVCDHEKLMADQLAERFDVPHSYSDVDELLSAVRPDVIHVTTPPQSHLPLATKCLLAGCHVYIEKPFALNGADARCITSLAEERGLKVTVGHNFQFSPEMIRMRESIRRGILGGPPLHIESTFSYRLGDKSYVGALLNDKNHWVRGLPGGLLQNVISHGICKIAEFLDGHQLAVSSYGLTSPVLQSMGGDELIDELRVIIRADSGTTAYFTFTTQIYPPVEELRLFGPKGTIVVDNLHRTVLQLGRSQSDFRSYLNFFASPLRMLQQYGENACRNVIEFLKSDFHMDAGMKNLIELFHESIRSDGPPPIPYSEILLTTSIMENIFDEIRIHNHALSKKDAHAAAVTQ
jgi:predicted dehydrogenase